MSGRQGLAVAPVGGGGDEPGMRSGPITNAEEMHAYGEHKRHILRSRAVEVTLMYGPLQAGSAGSVHAGCIPSLLTPEVVAFGRPQLCPCGLKRHHSGR